MKPKQDRQKKSKRKPRASRPARPQKNLEERAIGPIEDDDWGPLVPVAGDSLADRRNTEHPVTLFNHPGGLGTPNTFVRLQPRQGFPHMDIEVGELRRLLKFATTGKAPIRIL